MLADAIKLPFCWIFGMPSIENRPRIQNILRYFIYMDYDRRYNEAYVYYKTFLLNLWLNAFFLAMYYVSFARHINIDLGLFAIHYRPEAAVDELVYGYPLYVFPILAIVTIVYSITLFLLHTDYLAKKRIISEKVPILDSNEKLYDLKPPYYVFAFLFSTYGGFALHGFAEIFRSYDLYNYLYDFRSHTTRNFLLYGFVYFVLYQTVLCQFFVLLTINSIRSVLRHYIYKKHINENSEGEF